MNNLMQDPHPDFDDTAYPVGDTDTSTQDPSGEDLKPGDAPVLDMAGHAGKQGVTHLPPDLLDIVPAGARTETLGSWGKNNPVAPVVTLSSRVNGGKMATFIPKGWTIRGEIESGCPVQIGGEMNGDILMEAHHRLDVLSGATVNGTITGLDIAISGKVNGDIDASGGKVSIEEGACIVGKVVYTRIRMSDGEHQISLVHVPSTKASTAGG